VPSARQRAKPCLRDGFMQNIFFDVRRKRGAKVRPAVDRGRGGFLSTAVGDDLQALALWTYGAHGSSHALADLHGVEAKFGECATEGVAVHVQLFGRFALVAAVVRKHLEDVPLLKLADSIGVGDTLGVHLEDEIVEIAFQIAQLPYI
jgi:hypothetical protein